MPDTKTAALGAFFRMLLPKQKVFLVYDWEVRREAQKIVNSLRADGIDVGWDQDWLYCEASHRVREAIDASDLILVYSSPYAHESEPLRAQLEFVSQCARPIIELSTGASWVPHAGMVPVITGRYHGLAQRIVNAAKPLGLGSPAAIHPALAHGGTAQALVDVALEENHNIPFDVIGDRLVLSPKVRPLLEHAVTVHGPQWRRSKLEFARVLRFHGEWTRARDELSNVLAVRDTSLRPELLLELGSLEFEMGDIATGLARVESVLSIISDSDLPLLIKTLRQLGNMQREQSNWERAREYLAGARVLASTMRERRSGRYGAKAIETVIATLMVCDCLREQAGLLQQSGKHDECLKAYDEALTIAAQSPQPEAFEYLRGVIHYHLGRFHIRHTRQPAEAIKHLESSMEILQRYDNPVRVSFACDYLARAFIKRGVEDDHQRAKSLLNKAKRVRQAVGHRYMVARSDQGIGDCHRDLGDYDAAIESYRGACAEFTALHKLNDRGAAYLSLGLVHKRKYEHSRDNIKRTEAANCFRIAVQQYKDIQLEDKVREAEYLLLSLEDTGSRSLEELRADAEEQGIELHMDEVGEYRFHSWIRNLCTAGQPTNCLPDDSINISVDVGDDAAVLALCREGYEVVLTTDAAPASLSRRISGKGAAALAADLDRAAYVARFSVVHTLSDVLAMGAQPVALLLNMHLPRDTPVVYAMQIVKGVFEEASRYGARLIGGDMKERAERSIGCVGVGIVKNGHSISRKGGEPGDILAITQARNPDGSGIRRIGCRWAHEFLEHRKLTDQEPYRSILNDGDWKRELLFLNGEIARITDGHPGKIKAAMDTSDGIMACLQLLGRENDIHFELREDLAEAAIDERVRKIAQALGCPPSQFLFNAGHDWEIVMLVAPDDFPTVQRAFQDLGGDLAPLGTAHAGAQRDILFVKREGDTKRVPFFTDEKFVLHATEERILDWDDLARILR